MADRPYFKGVFLGGLTVIVVTTVMHSERGCWGSRGQTAVYTTQYHGKQATVVREDIIFGKDQYRLLIDGQEASEARKYDCDVFMCDRDYAITDDHGKLITVHEYSYSIK